MRAHRILSFLKNKMLLTFILIILALSVPLNAYASVPVSSGFESPKGTVTVVMHYEDVSAIERIQAMLEHDLIALEYAFNRLQKEGKLDPRFPRLVIEATKYYSLENRFETEPTVLSFTNSATLVCANPDRVDFDPRELGPAYIIRTSMGLLNYRELVAMLLLLSSLNDQTPTITIGSEQELEKVKALPGFADFLNLELKQIINQVGPGGLTLAADWKSDGVHATALHYSLTDDAGNVVAELMPLSVYVGRPAWPPAERQDWQGRIIAYASPDQAVVYDLAKNKYHTLNLNFTFEDPRIREAFDSLGGVQRVQFAMHSTNNKVFVIPFGRILSLHVVYSLNLDTGEWKRELEGESLFEQVFEPTPMHVLRNRLGLDFLPAITERRIRNVGIAAKTWTAGDRNPVIPSGNEWPADEPTVITKNYTQALWLLLPMTVAAAIILINFTKRNRRKA